MKDAFFIALFLVEAGFTVGLVLCLLSSIAYGKVTRDISNYHNSSCCITSWKIDQDQCKILGIPHTKTCYKIVWSVLYRRKQKHKENSTIERNGFSRLDDVTKISNQYKVRIESEYFVFQLISFQYLLRSNFQLHRVRECGIWDLRESPCLFLLEIAAWR